MAINSFEHQCDKIQSKCPSISSRGSRALPGRLMNLSITADDSITSSSDSKSSKQKKLKSTKSPYLTGDEQGLSRLTEKNLHAQLQKTTDIVSSFALAANIYRANSDEFRSTKKTSRKVKKSVLTLPNALTNGPQTCTVSDTNDSKYFDHNDHSKLRPKKKQAQNRKSRVRSKDFEFYDRDARYCSQMNIDLDCSSTDMFNQFTGDGIRNTAEFRTGKGSAGHEFNVHDVWSVLRNINRFQFRPSPPMSTDSIQTLKKKRTRNKRKINRKDTGVIETCRTEEFAYISSYDVDSKSPISFSQTSSFDRITVIGKQEDFNEICTECEKSIIKAKNTKMKSAYPAIQNQNKKNKKINKNIKPYALREHNVSDLQNNKLHIAYKTYDNRACDDQNKVTNIENPETLIAMKNGTAIVDTQEKYAKNKPMTNSYEINNDTDFKVDRAKASSGTLHSRSSKAGVDISTNVDQDCKSKLLKVSLNKSSQRLNGITKVILNHGQTENLLRETDEKQIKKHRLDSKVINTTPSIIPKLTQTEIKRKPANLKFPMVILGKDQLTSTPFQVMDFDLPYLKGLEQHVWPFMQSWYDPSTTKRDNEYDKQKKGEDKIDNCNNLRYKHYFKDRKNNNYCKIKNDRIEKKQTTSKDKKHYLQNEFIEKEQLVPQQLVSPIEINNIKAQQPKISKPMHQLKDKMLKILYKKTLAKESDGDKVNSEGDSTSGNCVQKHKSGVDIGTETFMKYEVVSQGLRLGNTAKSPRSELGKMPTLVKQPWARARWASDFIESVMKKIRSGVYYNQENKQVYKPPIMGKDVSIQTELTETSLKTNEALIKKAFVKEKRYDEIIQSAQFTSSSHSEALPGFENSLPALEIKTLNMKEVAVKHCTTNVLVQFDVKIPSMLDPLNCVQESSLFVPLSITESNTKIFKCKTTIINAMLPAEICSILPKILRNILDSEKISPLPYIAPFHCQSTSDCLYTISELSHSESQDIFKSPLLSSFVNLSPGLLKTLKGMFSTKKNKAVKTNKVSNLTLTYHAAENIDNLLVKLSVRQVISWVLSPLAVFFFNEGVSHIQEKRNDIKEIEPNTSYTALKLYKGTILDTNLEKCSGNILKNLCNPKLNICLKIGSYSIPFLLTFDDKRITVILAKNNDGFEEETASLIDYDKKYYLNNSIKTHQPLENLYKNSARNGIEYNINSNQPNRKNTQTQNRSYLSHKARRTKFVKLYKKCKSTSNISGERISTLLSKIVSLDDFFQALGSGKLISSIFDGYSEKKIISSIVEMKNWISEISQRQAMLLLLLTNKKDTPNLIRFRPILLQGIAVNRITRASELDMEIEVIERENFHKSSDYVGIPYVTECVDNRDNLMEELYWIAKTTASDYQKPFDDAAEKLLKSLLEKRKKLNPSYLRVMARYVGLGLLKSPNKKNN